MGDQGLGRPLASLLVLLLLLQTFTGAFSCSLTAIAGADAAVVICSDSGYATLSPKPAKPVPMRDPCPCGTCCVRNR